VSRLALRLCAIAYAMLALAAFAATWFPALRLLQAPSLQLGLLGVMLAAVLVLARQRFKAIVVIAASAIFWIAVAPFWLASEDKLDESRPTVRLALLQNSNARAVEYILLTQPDLVAIADPSSPERDRTSDLEAAYPLRLRLAEGGPIVLARQGLGLEPMPGSRADLELLRARILHGDSSFDLAVVHLGRPWPLGAGSKNPTDPVADLATNLAGDTSRIIILGDFNRTPWMSDMMNLSSASGVSAKTAPGTWPGWMPRPFRLPLDLVIVGRDLSVKSVQLGPDLGSDHLPVIAEIGLKRVIAEAE
jgi:endonuclease/exonuclease/phosphatase (EEP) superfamily protein YafD